MEGEQAWQALARHRTRCCNVSCVLHTLRACTMFCIVCQSTKIDCCLLQERCFSNTTMCSCSNSITINANINCRPCTQNISPRVQQSCCSAGLRAPALPAAPWSSFHRHAEYEQAAHRSLFHRCSLSTQPIVCQSAPELDIQPSPSLDTADEGQASHQHTVVHCDIGLLVIYVPALGKVVQLQVSALALEYQALHIRGVVGSCRLRSSSYTIGVKWRKPAGPAV